MYSVSSDFKQSVKGNKNAKYSVRKEIEITKTPVEYYLCQKNYDATPTFTKKRAKICISVSLFCNEKKNPALLQCYIY